MTLKPAAPSATAVDPGSASLEHLNRLTDLPLPELFRRVCEHAAEVLRVERTGVWLFVNGDRTLRCVSLFERSKRRHSKGACLSLEGSPAYLEAVASTPLLATTRARSDPRTAELGDSYLAPNGITSLLDAPLIRDDRLVGVLAHEHVGPPREWTDADREFARSMAEFVVTRMKAAETSLKTSPWQVVVPVSGRADAERSSPSGISADAIPELRRLLDEILTNANLIGLMSNLPSGARGRLERIRLAVERGLGRLGTSDDSISNSKDDTGEHEPLPPSPR